MGQYGVSQMLRRSPSRWTRSFLRMMYTSSYAKPCATELANTAIAVSTTASASALSWRHSSLRMECRLHTACVAHAAQPADRVLLPGGEHCYSNHLVFTSTHGITGPRPTPRG